MLKTYQVPRKENTATHHLFLSSRHPLMTGDWIEDNLSDWSCMYVLGQGHTKFQTFPHWNVVRMCHGPTSPEVQWSFTILRLLPVVVFCPIIPIPWYVFLTPF